MTNLPHLASRIFGTPLLVYRPKLDLILAVMGRRLGVGDFDSPADYDFTNRQDTHINDQSYITENIAIIPIYGTLVRRTVGLEAESGLTSYACIKSRLEAAVSNTSITGIILEIDSPGGEVGGVFDLADAIRAYTEIKPIWAVANDIAFSAAYILASATNKIYVNRMGGVGSIGVIAMHIDQSAMDSQEGLKYTAIYAGNHKNDLSPHAPLTSEAKVALQSEVNRIYEIFVDTVSKYRGLSIESLRATEADLFFGPNAVANGLADVLGTLDTAIADLSASRNNTQESRLQNTLGYTMDNIQPITNNIEKDLATTAGANVGNVAPIASQTALEIAQLCTLAGQPNLIVKFLEANLSSAQVRSQLLDIRATAVPEIQSHITASSGTQSGVNPLIEAAKQLAAKSTGGVTR